MQFLTNTYDPTKPEAEHYVICEYDQGFHDVWCEHKAWLQDKIIGEPKATEHLTVEELKQQNYVGMYTNT